MGNADNVFLQRAHLPFALVFVALLTSLGYIPTQSDFGLIMVLFIPAFLLYVYICQSAEEKKQVVFWIGAGVLTRFILVFAFPNLSDDIYRFVWDGTLLVNDVNPFEQLPGHYLGPEYHIPGIDEDLYNELNSPNYFTIYPPIAQTVFAAAVSFAGDNLALSSILMKVFLLALSLIHI